jgi:hypothetical protein
MSAIKGPYYNYRDNRWTIEVDGFGVSEDTITRVRQHLRIKSVRNTETK